MIRNCKYILATAIVSACLFQVTSAEPKDKEKTTTVKTTTTTKTTTDFTMPRHYTISSDLIGRPVISDGKPIGTFQDYVVDVNSGRIVYGVSSFDTVEGASGKLYPIPWPASQYSVDNRSFVVKLPPDRLVTATSFPEKQWPDFTDDKFTTTTFKYYNETPWWDGTKTVTTTTTEGSKERTPTLVSYKERWTSRPTTVSRISELRGREILASDGTRIGQINDVVVDPESGRILYAIEGTGATRHAIPWVALQPGTGNTYQVKITSDRIKTAPIFEETRITDRAWGEEVHRYYSVDPYWTVTTRETKP